MMKRLGLLIFLFYSFLSYKVHCQDDSDYGGGPSDYPEENGGGPGSKPPKPWQQYPRPPGSIPSPDDYVDAPFPEGGGPPGEGGPNEPGFIKRIAGHHPPSGGFGRSFGRSSNAASEEIAKGFKPKPRNPTKKPNSKAARAGNGQGRGFSKSSSSSSSKYPRLPQPECPSVKKGSRGQDAGKQHLGFYIKVEDSKKCVDFHPPDQVHGNECGRTDVKWEIGVPQWAPDSSWVTLSLKEGKDKLCIGSLEDNNSGINATVCEDGEAKQLWKVEPLEHASNLARIVENNSCNCLTEQADKKGLGLESCRNDAPEQYWQLIIS